MCGQQETYEQVVLDKHTEADMAIPHEKPNEPGDWEVLDAGDRVSARSKRRTLKVRQNPCQVGCERDRRVPQCVRPVSRKNVRVPRKHTYETPMVQCDGLIV